MLNFEQRASGALEGIDGQTSWRQYETFKAMFLELSAKYRFVYIHTIERTPYNIRELEPQSK